MLEKLKSFLVEDAVFYSLLIILIAVVSFGLGRKSIELETRSESVIDNGQAFTPITSLNNKAAVAEAKTETQSSAQSVVASRSGTKYHLPDCAGAKQIKPENLIEFPSIEAAKAAGLTPAANCDGI